MLHSKQTFTHKRVKEWTDDLQAKGLHDLLMPSSFHFTPTSTNTELFSYPNTRCTFTAPCFAICYNFCLEYKLPSPSNQPTTLSSIFLNHLQKAFPDPLDKVYHSFFPLCCIYTCIYIDSTQKCTGMCISLSILNSLRPRTIIISLPPIPDNLRQYVIKQLLYTC